MRVTAIIAVLLGLVWSVWALVQMRITADLRMQAEYLRTPGASLPSAARVKLSVPTQMSRLSCYGEKQKWRLRYALFAAQGYFKQNRQSVYQELLPVVERAAYQRVMCQSGNGKAWFDLAAILIEREGFAARAQQALLQSQRLSANEAWLAEWRIYFWLRFADLTADNPQIRRAFEKDLDTIDNGFVWRKQRLYKRLGISDKKELFE